MGGRTKHPGTIAVLVAVAVAFGACDGDAEHEAVKTVEPVTTNNPAVAFAPLLRLDARERAWPMSAAHFLAHAGLEWNSGGRCGFDHDVTESGVPLSRAKTADEADELPLDPRRLGRTDVYRSPSVERECGYLNQRAYTSDQSTAPYDERDRPTGLRYDEGFSLDIDDKFKPGKRRLAGDGSLAGVPVYYASRPTGHGRVRLAYWALFGRAAFHRRRELLEGLSWGEGDWERIDVLAQRGRKRGVYRPVAVEYRVGERMARLPWDKVKLTGQSATHPVFDLARHVHTPRPGGSCRGCTEWPTWRLTRNVRDEPWWGYGGAWGAFQKNVFEPRSATGSGVSGPSPYEISASR